MTVKELIEKLEDFDPSMQVVVGGFDEFGYADIQRFEVVEVSKRNKERAEIFGEFGEESENPEAEKLTVLHIDH